MPCNDNLALHSAVLLLLVQLLQPSSGMEWPATSFAASYGRGGMLLEISPTSFHRNITVRPTQDAVRPNGRSPSTWSTSAQPVVVVQSSQPLVGLAVHEETHMLYYLTLGGVSVYQTTGALQTATSTSLRALNLSSGTYTVFDYASPDGSCQKGLRGATALDVHKNAEGKVVVLDMLCGSLHAYVPSQKGWSVISSSTGGCLRTPLLASVLGNTTKVLWADQDPLHWYFLLTTTQGAVWVLRAADAPSAGAFPSVWMCELFQVDAGMPSNVIHAYLAPTVVTELETAASQVYVLSSQSGLWRGQLQYNVTVNGNRSKVALTNAQQLVVPDSSGLQQFGKEGTCTRAVASTTQSTTREQVSMFVHLAGSHQGDSAVYMARRVLDSWGSMQVPPELWRLTLPCPAGWRWMGPGRCTTRLRDETYFTTQNQVTFY
jgi:hypothetical protein